LFRKNDLILLVVTFGSIGVAIAFPEWCRVFLPYPLYLMMIFLFFSFLKIEFLKIFKNVRKTASILFVLCLVKLILLPGALYLVASVIWPKYAFPVLLLSGASTGVVAPFLSGLLGASTLLVLMMVALSSLLVPLTLPAMVKFFVGRTVELSFLSMVNFLSLVVFIPAATSILIRRSSPYLTKKLEEIQFPVSMVLFGLVNLGVFPKYASFFRERPGEIGGAILVAFVLSAICYAAGFLATWGLRREEHLAGAASFAYMNSVLIIVFSAQFSDPLSPILAVVYMFPLFMLIVPARMVGERVFR
jgi:bile acid:Na+ symporter, BASS family